MTVTDTLPQTAAARTAAHLLLLQQDAGCWEGEMEWCPVVTAQVVIARHAVGLPFGPDDAAKILLHFERAQTRDGAFGLHPEHPGSVFVTAMVYVASRMLGVGPDRPLTTAARKWLHARPGGVRSVPTWGKFWLALLGLYGHDGLRPLVPELVLLPKAVPVHPMRFYCHTRYIYLAMSVLQGGRVQFDLGTLGKDLRRELYGEAGMPESFRAHRYDLAADDAFEPPGLLVRAAERVLGWYDCFPIRKLREAAFRKCEALIARDLAATQYLTLSPVNGTLNAMALFARGAPATEIAKCVAGFEYYRWEDEARGLRYAGGRTRTWDTGFAVEALLASPEAAREYREPLLRAYRFLAAQQMTRPVAARDPLIPDTAEGGWCLGDAAHAWPVSDCTAEALSAILGMHAALGVPDRIPDARLAQVADFILSRQNRDGGFGSYDAARAPLWLERLNPSEMFTRCMTDQSYVECTGSCLVALSRFRAALPAQSPSRIDRAIARGGRFLLKAQRPDGAFPGSWGIYLTYGTFHAVRGLRAAGVPAESPVMRRAAEWLVRHQKPDGGWGEHHEGCLRQEYVEHPQSQATMTSWAVLALVELVGASHPVVRRGAEWLARHQRAEGDYAREAVNGVFFGTAMLDYELYRAYFPAWALARVAAG
jgi:lanosterol synthase